MAMQVPTVEDTELNMTPMIDIVFQLIVFFLLTLHFSTPEYRIESQLPKDRGLAATPQFVSELNAIKVKLFRRNKENPDEAYTYIKVGNSWDISLPKGQWTGKGEADAKRQQEIDRVFATLAAKIKEDWAAQGTSPDQKGEISAPPPSGPSVPHGDVVRVLDTFLAVGITTVNFEGAIAPLTSSEGGTMYR